MEVSLDAATNDDPTVKGELNVLRDTAAGGEGNVVEVSLGKTWTVRVLIPHTMMWTCIKTTESGRGNT